MWMTVGIVIGIFIAFLLPSPIDGWVKSLVRSLWEKLKGLFTGGDGEATE